jgi:hypothetical protein
MMSCHGLPVSVLPAHHSVSNVIADSTRYTCTRTIHARELRPPDPKSVRSPRIDDFVISSLNVDTYLLSSINRRT